MIFVYLFQFLTFIFFLALFFQILKFSLFCLYIYQLVEYRFDRLKVRLKNKGDLEEILAYFNFLNFLPPNKYPKLTVRVILIFLLFIFLIYQLFFLFYRAIVFLFPFNKNFVLNLFLVSLLIYYLVPFLLLLLVFFFNFLLLPLKKFIFYIACQKIKAQKNLKIIGITGSYGKTLTKELVARILATKYSVLKTPQNVNTQIGIAFTVIFSLKKHHQIFVVEMGAYKQGEIKAVCQMVRPQIGILTGINEQHLALFGDFHKLLQAKYELIQSLPAEGLGLFNGKNKYCRQLSKRKKKCLTVLYGEKSKFFEENLAAAIFLARYFKIPFKKIKKEIKRLKRLISLKVKRGKGGILVFDESYATNPTGFLKALEIIKQRKEKKIVVTPGIIELGKATVNIHRQLGRELAEIADKIIITNKNFAEFFLSGAGKKAKNKFLVSSRSEEIINFIKGCRQKNWLVLLEGRIPVEIKKIFLRHV